jgi:hypothetical protein
MQGLVFKAAIVAVTFFAAIFISSLSLAGQSNIYAATGCMGCHQGEPVTDNNTARKHPKKAPHEAQANHSRLTMNSSPAHAA